MGFSQSKENRILNIMIVYMTLLKQEKYLVIRYLGFLSKTGTSTSKKNNQEATKDINARNKEGGVSYALRALRSWKSFNTVSLVVERRARVVK
jgi:hypothetical protein